MKIFIFCFLVAVNGFSQTPSGEWFLTTQKPVKAVVLLAHGLNLKPSKMDTLAGWLVSQGADVFRPALMGHRGDGKDFGKVTREIWLDEMKRSYDLAKIRAQTEGVPVFFVGYSLGALLYLDLLSTDEVHSQKMVLLAPPLALEVSDSLIKTLARIKGKDYQLPSRSLKEYRANDGTSMAAYLALIESKNFVTKTDMKNLNFSTLLFINPEDELIDYSDLKNILKKNNLSNWSLAAVSNSECLLSKCYDHLIIDDKSLGVNQWKSVLQKIKWHFNF